ncbi:MAG TPA: FtsQ-type POTRA domain-containing protein [Peptostreptococcaceae bacterium]|nr:FtsQ-type POTRA domain-containing protein [Peptostreptococcaceae bacterium]
MKRKKDKNKIKKKTSVVIFVTIFSFALLGYIFINTENFTVKDIKIFGQNVLNKEAIIKSANIELDKNIFTYNIGQIEKKLEKNPYIKNVDVKRKFPNELIFNIVEIRETAIIPYMGSFAYIDNNGIILKIDDEITNNSIPIINGINLEDAMIGSKLDTGDKKLSSNIINLLNDCNKNDISSEIQKMQINNKKYITIYTKRGIVVDFGEIKNINYKFSSLNQVLIDLQTKGINSGTVDLSYNKYAIYKPN